MEHSDHESVITKILKKEFNESPSEIKRITVGLCNEVYSVTTPTQSIVIRLHDNGREMRGSEKFIPIFRSLGISVPQIIASDYSKSDIPFAYQVQTKIKGVDIGRVIQDLDKKQLERIAIEVANIFRKVKKLPTNGKFGCYSMYEENLFDSWTECLQNMLRTIRERNAKTGVVGDTFINTFKNLLIQYQDYFSSVKSVCYFDDISSKNVLIDNGKFSGLVDLDEIAYGDPLEAVGRIKASWFGIDYGKIYTEAVQNELKLNNKEKEVVLVYAALNRIYWLSEEGIQFNKNTSASIDQRQIESSKKTIQSLLAEIPIRDSN